MLQLVLIAITVFSVTECRERIINRWSEIASDINDYDFGGKYESRTKYNTRRILAPGYSTYNYPIERSTLLNIPEISNQNINPRLNYQQNYLRPQNSRIQYSAPAPAPLRTLTQQHYKPTKNIYTTNRAMREISESALENSDLSQVKQQRSVKEDLKQVLTNILQVSPKKIAQNRFRDVLGGNLQDKIHNLLKENPSIISHLSKGHVESALDVLANSNILPGEFSAKESVARLMSQEALIPKLPVVSFDQNRSSESIEEFSNQERKRAMHLMRNFRNKAQPLITALGITPDLAKKFIKKAIKKKSRTQTIPASPSYPFNLEYYEYDQGEPLSVILNDNVSSSIH